MQNEDDISYLYNEFDKITDGYDYNTVMVAMAAFYADLIKDVTNGDTKRIRQLYEMMSDAAVLLAENHDSDHEFQAQENPIQEEEGQEQGQAPRNERNPSDSH